MVAGVNQSLLGLLGAYFATYRECLGISIIAIDNCSLIYLYMVVAGKSVVIKDMRSLFCHL